MPTPDGPARDAEADRDLRALRARRLARVVAAAGADRPAPAICEACTALLGVAGTSLMVMRDGLPTRLAASDRRGSDLEDLQHALGEGPCIDAHESGRAVSEPDLGAPRRGRWAAFGPRALDTGAAALFSFPMRVGGVRLGALTVHMTAPGSLASERRGEAQAIAGIAAVVVLTLQSEAPEGALGAGLRSLVTHHAGIHQASGVVSVQLGVGVGEALVRLRAYAYARGLPLAEVAAEVVAGRLRLDP